MNPEQITFSIKDPNWVEDKESLVIQSAPTIEILKISKDGFFYKGEKVEDTHNIYERFNDWLKATGY